MARRIGAWMLALLLGTAIGVWAGSYFAGGVTLMYVTPSPDGRERVEFYHANRWHAMWRGGDAEPGFVRLTRIAGDETLGTSAVFDLVEGEVFWTARRVQIGTSATYDRGTGVWTVAR